MWFSIAWDALIRRAKSSVPSREMGQENKTHVGSSHILERQILLQTIYASGTTPRTKGMLNLPWAWHTPWKRLSMRCGGKIWLELSSMNWLVSSLGVKLLPQTLSRVMIKSQSTPLVKLATTGSNTWSKSTRDASYLFLVYIGRGKVRSISRAFGTPCQYSILPSSSWLHVV